MHVQTHIFIDIHIHIDIHIAIYTLCIGLHRTATAGRLLNFAERPLNGDWNWPASVNEGFQGYTNPKVQSIHIQGISGLY